MLYLQFSWDNVRIGLEVRVARKDQLGTFQQMRWKVSVVGRWQQIGRWEHVLVKKKKKKSDPQRSRSFSRGNSLEVEIRSMDDSESLLRSKGVWGLTASSWWLLSVLVVHTWIHSQTLGVSLTSTFNLASSLADSISWIYLITVPQLLGHIFFFFSWITLVAFWVVSTCRLFSIPFSTATVRVVFQKDKSHHVTNQLKAICGFKICEIF